MPDRITSKRVREVSREMYLPETGPARARVDRPKDVRPLPAELYLRPEAPKKTTKK